MKNLLIKCLVLALIILYALPLRGKAPEPFVISTVEELEVKHPARSFAYWSERVSKIKIGMSKREVMEILGLSENCAPILTARTCTGGANCESFPLDKVWSFGLCYDYHSKELGVAGDQENRVISIGEVIEGGWSRLLSGKCEPVAGGDATR